MKDWDSHALYRIGSAFSVGVKVACKALQLHAQIADQVSKPQEQITCLYALLAEIVPTEPPQIACMVKNGTS